MVMAAGERARLGRSGRAEAPGTPRAAAPVAQADRSRMDQVPAWKRGEALFDDVPLSEAVAEMSRYSPAPIKLTGADILGGLSWMSCRAAEARRPRPQWAALEIWISSPSTCTCRPKPACSRRAKASTLPASNTPPMTMCAAAASLMTSCLLP